MKYEKRMELEALSLKAFGTKHAYLKRMKQPSHYETDVFSTAKGKRSAGYANIEQITQAMIQIISENSND